MMFEHSEIFRVGLLSSRLVRLYARVIQSVSQVLLFRIRIVPSFCKSEECKRHVNYSKASRAVGREKQDGIISSESIGRVSDYTAKNCLDVGTVLSSLYCISFPFFSPFLITAISYLLLRGQPDASVEFP